MSNLRSYDIKCETGILRENVRIEVKEENGIHYARQANNRFAEWQVINQIPSGAKNINGIDRDNFRKCYHF